MRLIAALFFVAVASALVVMWGVNKQQPSAQPVQISEDVQKTETVNEPAAVEVTEQEVANLDVTSARYRLQKIHERSPDSSITEEQILAVMEKPFIWKQLDKVPENLPLSEEKIRDGREFISLDSLKLETLVIGDTVELPLAQTGRTYFMKVEGVQDMGDGNTTWSGQLSDSGAGYHHVSFTRGASGVTVGGINSPDGHFTVEGRGDTGWVVLSRVDAVNREEGDAIIPDFNE